MEKNGMHRGTTSGREDVLTDDGTRFGAGATVCMQS